MERNAISTSLASSQLTERDVRGQRSPGFAATTGHLDDFAERMHSDGDAAHAAELDSYLIVDSIPAFVVLMTSTGELEHVNRPMREYFGATTGILEDSEKRDGLRECDLARLVRTFAQSINARDSHEMELRCRRFDGVERWFLARGVPLRHVGGRIVRWCFLLTDVEDRKRAETQLAADKQLLEMIVSGCSLHDVLAALCRFVEDAAPDCYCGVYPIDWGGPTFQYGVAPSLPSTYIEPIKGLPVRCDIAPCGIAAFQKTQVVVDDIESDPLWRESDYRTHVLTHGLRSVWSTPIYSLEGRVLGTFCIYQRKAGRPTRAHQDLIAQVTHIASIAIVRAESEAALKRSEALLAAGQRLSLTGTFFWRVATDEIIWSEQLYRIFDFDTAAPVTIERIAARLHPEDLSLFHATISRARTNGDDFEYDHRLQAPDNSLKYLHVVARGTRDADGRLEYIGAIQDVTDRRRSEAALAELAHINRVSTLGEMVASISHELAQPITATTNNAKASLRWLQHDPPDLTQVRKGTESVLEAGTFASEIINRLRSLCKNAPPRRELVAINEVVGGMAGMMGGEARGHGVSIRTELKDDLPMTVADRVQLQQVLMNLMLNGIEAMKDLGGEITVKSQLSEDGQIEISVHDTGPGLPLGKADQIFDAFFTTKPQGCGMGLAISKSIIESQGGRIWAKADDRRGATFHFTLPTAPAEAA